MALTDLGFNPLQERVYLALLDEPKASPARIAQLVDSPEERVRAALAGLVALEVATPDPTSASGIALGRPVAALGQLIERLEQDLMCRYRKVGDTRAELAALSSRHARPAAPDPASAGVERLDTLDAVREALAELSFFTSSSVYAVQPGGPLRAEALTASRPLDLRGLRRGITMRVIYAATVLDDEANRSYLRELTGAGAALRVTGARLERMVIMDERVAVIPIDPQDSARGALVVRQPGLLGGFLQLYQRLWDEAKPITWPGQESEPEPEPTEDDRQVLKLLASGCTDEAAARDVGISVRHLRRRVARLMSRLGAASRFEAGAEAARRGWI
ncbi:MAG TPA: hypothetical protein VFV67_01255 [Actinophytocola sp.]|uniref:hypothetical protein n=1 Tax=Actinophytocola sp. TaxID=1872138 RepID=UPI002DBA7551|nr:hypothetical protein [Actinophytocola sp.]HEU5469251.1 hypothetical protein [Actinophytocola sp.]